MPHDGRDRDNAPDIDRLVARIRSEARERFPDDVQDEDALSHGRSANAETSGAREPLRARLKRNRWIGRLGRLIKGLLLAGRTRVQAAEADQAAQAALRDVTQLKTRLAGVEAQAGELQPLFERLVSAEDAIVELRQRHESFENGRVEFQRELEARLESAWRDLEDRVKAGEERAARAGEQAARAERGLRVARADLRARGVALDRVQAYLDGDTKAPVSAPAPAEPGLSTAEMEAFFSAFDEGLRGSAAEIAAGLRGYLPDLHAVGAGSEARPVLDLGCGRGTWLQVLRDDGIVARGIDLNRALVNAARADGLDAQVDDALSVLRGTADGSLGAITAFHLAEHLPFETLYAVVAEAHRTLAAGGLLLMETPNPENGYVGTHTFYHDPTHGNPLTPALMHFLADYHGYAEIEVRRVHPYPDAARLPDGVPANDRLNGWLCGPQDFSLLARKADDPAVEA